MINNINNESFLKLFPDIKDDILRQYEKFKNVDCLTSSFHEANKENRRLVELMVNRLLKKGSTILGIENILKLYEKTKEGKSSILLLEHYSNFDLPSFITILTNMGHKEIAQNIVSIAGVKIFRDSNFVKIFSTAFNVILIYPPHSLIGVSSDVLKERKAFNVASMKELFEKKNQGFLILLFPTATRYRPGREETRKVMNEVGSYLKIFDYFVLSSINGNILRLSENEDMSQDYFVEDLMLFNVSKVYSSEEYRNSLSALLGEDVTKEDLNAKIAQDIQDKFRELHKRGEELYNKLV